MEPSTWLLTILTKDISKYMCNLFRLSIYTHRWRYQWLCKKQIPRDSRYVDTPSCDYKQRAAGSSNARRSVKMNGGWLYKQLHMLALMLYSCEQHTWSITVNPIFQCLLVEIYDNICGRNTLLTDITSALYSEFQGLTFSTVNSTEKIIKIIFFYIHISSDNIIIFNFEVIYHLYHLVI
ncbi:uncharacterized protein LOC105433953 [Pogonomyrmex barbatus]|uniref:Uncharacterized protein LOC105433953 n=1 Tax=Pogonomyrmex barbatus TaxID=144034 RepID=A0A8N1SC82_9HYME|nr:uncharacterized protein LOC105433953 [Pogonomyrmex barbatus]